MKRIKSILTVLMAAVFAMSLVPAGAWADTTSADTGHFGDTTDNTRTLGKITISDAEDDETYSLYKILDLASFSDSAKAAGEHDTDAYSYVIKSDSPWLPFIEDYEEPANTKAFSVDKNNAVTFSENGLSGSYYVVKLANHNPFGNPASDATYDEDQIGEHMNSAAEVQKFAKKALEFATATGAYASPYTYSNGQPQKAATDVSATSSTVEWDNLDLGWYLVGTTLGSLVALDTTNNQVTMQEKNEKPSIEKKVKDSSSTATRQSGATPYPDGTWVENTAHKIGETAHFKTDVSLRKNGKGYVLHDVLEEGLTLVPSTINVYAKTDTTAAYTAAAYSQVTASSETPKTFTITSAPVGEKLNGDKCDFTIAFDDAWVAGLNFDDAYTTVVQVEYDAVLNEKAVVIGDIEAVNGTATPTAITSNKLETGSDAAADLADVNHSRLDGRNTNQTILTYGAGSSTKWDNATVETYQFDVVKTKDAATGTQYDLLAGAKFKLYEDNNGSKGTQISFHTDTADYVYRYAVIGNSETNAVSEFTTDGTHALKFKGLKPGTYWLEESAAPDGYNKLSNLIKVVIDDKGAVHVEDGDIAAKIDATIDITTSGNAKTPGTVYDAIATATIDPASKYDTAHQTAGANDQGGVQVINLTGPELPSTGGIGTTIFYVAGTVLVVGAAVMLVAKRRMGAEA